MTVYPIPTPDMLASSGKLMDCCQNFIECIMPNHTLEVDIASLPRFPCLLFNLIIIKNTELDKTKLIINASIQWAANQQPALLQCHFHSTIQLEGLHTEQ